MNFGISTDERSDGIAVIALSGEVDLYTAPELKHELVRLVDNGAIAVIVDLTDTTFIDSTTLGVLISGVRRLRPEGGKLELVVTDRNIGKIFEITGLDRVFAIHPEVDAALASMRAS